MVWLALWLRQQCIFGITQKLFLLGRAAAWIWKIISYADDAVFSVSLCVSMPIGLNLVSTLESKDCKDSATLTKRWMFGFPQLFMQLWRILWIREPCGGFLGRLHLLQKRKFPALAGPQAPCGFFAIALGGNAQLLQLLLDWDVFRRHRSRQHPPHGHS